jgi:hypoxanthine-DNA glycosylase
MKSNFPPVVDDRTRVLILGSLPGQASLTAGRYYAHPQNAFWRLMDVVTGCDIGALAYEDRLQALKAARIGLWDVIASAERGGSLDSAIRSPEAADLRGLVATLPELRAVAFNGKTAARLGLRTLAPEADRLRLIPMPSSSPAHARPFTEKAAAWAELRSMLA